MKDRPEYRQKVDTTKLRIASNLSYLIALSGKTQREIAELAGLDASYVSKLTGENAIKSDYTIKSLIRLGCALRVPIRVLIEEDLRGQASNLLKKIIDKDSSSFTPDGTDLQAPNP